MAKPKWRDFPHADKAYDYAGAALEKNWARLHAGDCEPFPSPANLKKLIAASPKLAPEGSLEDTAKTVQDAWRAYHKGDFATAVELGLAAGLLGYNAASKAANIYATYLEKDEKKQIDIFLESMKRGEKLQAAAPGMANAHYFYAQAAGRYSQGISIAKALAEGYAGKIKKALDTALKLEPKHADAHIALGAYHAEIINKVGGLVGGLTYGADKKAGANHYQSALKLNPNSAIARIECANGLVMMFGKEKLKEATKLYEEAAACKPLDAMERLDVEAAKEELS
jgi:hypothetical protein